MEKFLTVAEVATATSRHPETVRLALQAKELKGAQRIKRGPWLVRESDVEIWIFGEAVAA